MQICVNYYLLVTVKKLYHLSTCSTCKRIINDLNLPSDIAQQDIKNMPITKEQLQELAHLSGTYEALFNKRSRLFLAQKKEGFQPDESAYKRMLLEHYTYLKRPVFVIGGQIFIGNSTKTIDQVKSALHE